MTRLVQPVEEPETEDLADLPFPLRACPECGYIGVRSPEARDGMVAGSGALISAIVCPRCKYAGLPAEFDAPEDYQDYVAGLHEQA